jgi:hypothetical protein
METADKNGKIMNRVELKQVSYLSQQSSLYVDLAQNNQCEKKKTIMTKFTWLSNWKQIQGKIGTR